MYQVLRDDDKTPGQGFKVNVAMWPFYITIATFHTNLTRKLWAARQKKGCVNTFVFS